MNDAIRYISRLLIALAMLLPMRLYAIGQQGEGSYHFASFSLGGGYTSLCNEINNAHTSGSYALLGGIGYEFLTHGYWLSLGAQFMRRNSTLTATYQTKEYPAKDDLGDKVNLRYAISQTDQQHWQTIDLPILMGYYYKGLFIGAGAKIGINFHSSVSTQGTYELIGRYNSGMELRNWGYYTTYPSESRTSCTWNPEIAILGEIGYDVLSLVRTRKAMCHILKICIYGEYSPTNMRTSPLIDPLTIPDPSDATKAIINPYILSTQSGGSKVANYMVGVKLTYMIGGSRNNIGTYHKGCECYGD